jgi:hypothetical protein
MRFWKIYCEEDDYPGLWQRWFQEQCVAVGWPPGSGYHLVGNTYKEHGWSAARTSLQRIAPGDRIVVHLKNRRLGKVGEVARKQTEDSEWNPLVPKSTSLPHGELGRRILVRWDLTMGPSDRDQVVHLPKEIKLAPNVFRRTLLELDKKTFHALERVMRQPERWRGLLSHFAREKSLSDYIAAYPHRLEDELRPYPSREVREKVFVDRSRSDVLLLDRDNAPVIVECKQDPPTAKNIQQLAGYLRNLHKEAPRLPKPRGILIHTGARKLSEDVRKEIRRSEFKIEALEYQLIVGFNPCQ